MAGVGAADGLGSWNVSELAMRGAAAGVASALRETALSAERRAGLARQSLDGARLEAMAASSRRRAAERLQFIPVAQGRASPASPFFLGYFLSERGGF